MTNKIENGGKKITGREDTTRTFLLPKITEVAVGKRFFVTARAGDAIASFTIRFAISCLNIFFLQCDRAIHFVQFVIQATSVANVFSVSISTPECRGVRVAIRTENAAFLHCRLKRRVRMFCVVRRRRRTYETSFRFDQRSILSVHLMIKSTGVAEIIAVAIASPERRGFRSAIDTFSAVVR